jgi:hypothetical protein
MQELKILGDALFDKMDEKDPLGWDVGIVEIEKLSDDDVRDFLSNTFEKADITVNPKAMDFMVHFSSGLPILMHEIGDATFWSDTDGVINRGDVFQVCWRRQRVLGKSTSIQKCIMHFGVSSTGQFSGN